MTKVHQDPVVVTGLGATTPLGGDVPSTWEALLAGVNGVGLLTDDWVDTVPIHIAARVAVEPTERIDRVRARRLDRSMQFALIAGQEAWESAGRPDVDRERLAVVMASGIGGVLTLLSAYDTLKERGARRVSPLTVPMLMPNGPAATLGLEFQARGGVHTPVSACASGAEAIALGLDLLRLDRADVVVVGGTEAAIHPLPIAGFAAMRAMSTREDAPQTASRPYDKQRDGFVLGEGSGVLVLERSASAKARGATIHAEIAGAGITNDAFDIVAPDPVGAQASRAISRALRDAGANPDEVVHINAHATSTPVGDVAEAAAIRTALGDAASGAVVSATKSQTGHLLGAAGAVEAIFTVLALKHRLAPATRNLDDPDDEVDLDVARIDHRPLRDGVAVSNSFGFGGHNVALVFRSPS